MCRLLGVVATGPTSVADAVGDGVLKDFVALTKIHGDGWGVADVDRIGATPHVRVSAGSALDDADFGAATHDLRSAAALVHLRWATNGLAVEPQNSHPFRADGLAMAHNGSIKPMATLDDLLEPAVAASLRGTTDSERYFAVIRQHRRTAPSLAEAVRRAVAQLRQLYPDASLNALLLGEDQLIAVHAHARSRLLDEDIEEISATDLPAEHLEDYFSLRVARPADGVLVIGSTGFGDLPWEPLPTESVIAVSMRDLSTTVLPLAHH
ncbi:class II glutamine amidotransferase [Mycolicibacterium sp. 050158]|jgi:predicted glutamine amidotransferase|uniref:class II glutamine amidotransferase n=1 Tax=Mycolicibacterium sp. 050158 TaxID=3090602 RepID=UPI00299D40D1|nr:class II glutamine amidotransferase [Mycolicibacterium sp. 050158]MDX1892119.1 class II glutamine amidotransferase [Mycolicibacterium sp. 050158]